MKGTSLSRFQGLQFCTSFYLLLGAGMGGWGTGSHHSEHSGFSIVDHSLSHHCDILKRHHLSLTLLPGMITVQYLLSSHIQIKVVCTVRNIDSHFRDISSWDRPPPHTSIPYPVEGLEAQPTSLALGQLQGRPSLSPGLGGSCHHNFSKDSLRARSRNQTHGLGKAAGA